MPESVRGRALFRDPPRFSPWRGRRVPGLVHSFTSVPEKMMRMHRARGPRPVMLAIAGDSAAGKTTLARGLVAALGASRSTSLCVDDYHRYDRSERARSEEHTSELQSQSNLVCRLLLEK